jgi:hypothetical protein
MPTKRLPTLSAIAWLKQVVLPEIDRLEKNPLLADLPGVAFPYYRNTAVNNSGVPLFRSVYQFSA